MKPSVIVYKTEGCDKIKVTSVKYSDDEIKSWWKIMRSRIGNLAMVVPADEHPSYRVYLDELDKSRGIA